MHNHIGNTYNNLILAFCVFAFKLLAILSFHEGLNLLLTILSIVSVSLLIVINFKKAWYTIFKPKTKEDEN